MEDEKPHEEETKLPRAIAITNSRHMSEAILDVPAPLTLSWK